MKNIRKKERLQAEFKKDPSWFFSRYQRLAPYLDFIHLWQSKYKKDIVSHQTIANHMGMSPSNVKIYQDIAESLGLMTHWQRYNKPSKYKLASFFYDHEYRSILYEWMPSLRFISLGLLLSANELLTTPTSYLYNKPTKNIATVSQPTKKIDYARKIIKVFESEPTSSPISFWCKDPDNGYKLLKKEKGFRKKHMNFEKDSQPNYDKNNHKEGMIKSSSTSKSFSLPNKDHELVNYAKKLYREYINGKKDSGFTVPTLFYVTRSISNRKASCSSSAIENFKRWAGGTNEGREFMKVIFEK